MKQNKPIDTHDQKPASASRPTAAADTNGNSVSFPPSPDEVAKRAYFAFLRQGSLPGHDVEHWLEAELQLRAERDLTRVHAFHTTPRQVTE